VPALILSVIALKFVGLWAVGVLFPASLGLDRIRRTRT